MSISQNFPEEGPTLNLNFAGSRTLDPRITFTRTSSATFMGRDGLVKIAPANSARFDHRYNSTTGEVESLGLLVEESRSNLVLRSEEFDNASWTKSRTSINANVASSPTGTATADALIEDTSASLTHLVRADVTVAANTTYTVSIFAKAFSRTRFRLDFSDASTSADTIFAVFDLSTKTVVSSGFGGNGTFTSASVIEYQDGWSRCVLTGKFNNTDTDGRVLIYLDNGSNIFYTGDGTSGIYIWGAQLEVGAFPTSYIPTTATTATRTADNASITGSNFTEWYNQSEGTVYADTRMVGVQTGRYDRLWAITNSNLNFEGISIFLGGPGFTPLGKYVASMTVTNSATEQVGALAYGNQSATNVPRAKYAFAFKENDANSSFNGEVFTTDTSVALSSFTTPPDRLLIGQPQRFQGHSCMTISQLTYYPQRLQNSQLITLTK
jgi:hypothetical protein